MSRARTTRVAPGWRCLVPALLLAAALGGCSADASDQARGVAGVVRDLEFTLTDTAGHPVTEEAFRGHPVLLYFGYTHCPDVCPTTLARIAAALKRVEGGAEARVLFVTVDPERDTPEVLRQYAQAFGPGFVGLHGSDAQLLELAKRYRIAYSRGERDASGDYPVTHSSAVFVFDAKGRARLLVLPDSSVNVVVGALERLRSGG